MSGGVQSAPDQKGNRWYFGLKAHIGVDSRTGIVHPVCTTAASVADCHMLPELLHGEERKMWGDPGYQGQGTAICEALRGAQDMCQPPDRSKSGSEPGTEPNQGSHYKRSHKPFSGCCGFLESFWCAPQQPMRGRWNLKDEEWAVVEPVLRPARREDRRGRPWQDTRAVLNGVLWVLGTGAHWRELPERYPPYQTCRRRFQQWIHSGELEKTLKRLAARLHGQGKLDLDEAFIDATFASAKKGLAVGPTRRGKGMKIVAVAARHSLPPGPQQACLLGWLSPYLSRALARRSARLLKKRLPEASSMSCPRG